MPRFLIVDDHPIFLSGAAQVIRDMFKDAVCRTASSARHALDMADRGERFDVILADAQMPELDGYAFLKGLKARRLTTPVIVLSGTQDKAQIQALLEAGAAAFMPKEMPIENLKELIEAALLGENISHLSQLPADKPQSVVLPAPVQDRDAPQLASEMGITPRQFAVLQLIASGRSNKEIAVILSLAEPTVKSHMSALFRALGVRNRTSCVAQARVAGLVG